MKVVNDFDFTLEELQTISDLNSTHFGFIDWNITDNFTLRDLIRRAIKALQNVAAFLDSQKYYNVESSLPLSYVQARTLDCEIKGKSGIDVNTFCKLGHFHLILEEYEKALLAYQQYLKIKPKHIHNLDFLYGIGLVYFHFNAFRW